VTISRQLIDADLADLVFSGKNFSASKDAERTAGLAAPVVPIRRRAPAMCPGDVLLLCTMSAQTVAARA